jgi:flagellar hook-length control protein FliK
VEIALRVLPGFEAQLAARARELLEHGRTEIRVTLDPPSLGRLRVRLYVTGSEAVARISAGTSDAAAILQRERAELVRAFEQQGFSQVEVHVDSDAGGRFADRPDDSSAAPRGDAASSDAADDARRPAPRPDAGRVDLFV